MSTAGTVHAPARAPKKLPFFRLRAEAEERELQISPESARLAMSHIYSERQRVRNALRTLALRNYRRGWARGIRHGHMAAWWWGAACGGLFMGIVTALVFMVALRAGLGA